jgi:hypoxanthine phosphoribosyltransferase
MTTPVPNTLIVTPRQLPCPPERLTVHYSEEQLKTRIQELGEQITQAYADTSRLVVVIVLKGAFLFAADLIRHINLPCQVEFIRLASYGDGQTSSGVVRPVDLSLPSLTGEDVLVVEDIIDTGITLRFLLDYLGSALHTPKSLRLAVLLDKKEARQADVTVDYTGFEIGNEFVVGYGLDFAGYYRNLPFIGVIPPGEQPL